MECHSLQIYQEGITEVDDDAWFAGATTSDLEKRNRDVDEKRIDNERTTGVPSSHSELRNLSMTVGLDLAKP